MQYLADSFGMLLTERFCKPAVSYICMQVDLLSAAEVMAYDCLGELLSLWDMMTRACRVVEGERGRTLSLLLFSPR